MCRCMSCLLRSPSLLHTFPLSCTPSLSRQGRLEFIRIEICAYVWKCVYIICVCVCLAQFTRTLSRTFFSLFRTLFSLSRPLSLLPLSSSLVRGVPVNIPVTMLLLYSMCTVFHVFDMYDMYSMCTCRLMSTHVDSMSVSQPLTLPVSIHRALNCRRVFETPLPPSLSPSLRPSPVTRGVEPTLAACRSIECLQALPRLYFSCVSHVACHMLRVTCCVSISLSFCDTQPPPHTHTHTQQWQLAQDSGGCHRSCSSSRSRGT